MDREEQSYGKFLKIDPNAKIRVGKNFQAVIPPLKKEEKIEQNHINEQEEEISDDENTLEKPQRKRRLE